MVKNGKRMKNKNTDAKYANRLQIINKIKEYEAIGGENFFLDVENDPPSLPLDPNKVDFLQKKLISKIKTFIAVLMVKKLKKMATKRFELEIEGEENLQNIDGGAIITSNHFSQYESMCVMLAMDKAKINRRLHIVVREGNFFMPGGVGFILKHLYTLPLISSRLGTKMFMDSIKTVLAQKKMVLVYPEQSMWWNYRKPKKYRTGAYYMACRNNVPIVPCFVTMTNIAGVDENGIPNQKYTIHVMPPIYKDPTLSEPENSELMLNKNYDLCKAKYEEVYGIKLEYNGTNFLC